MSLTKSFQPRLDKMYIKTISGVDYHLYKDEEEFRKWEGIEEDWEDFNKKDNKPQTNSGK